MTTGTPYDYVPSPSIAPPRWPGLVASVGGEVAIREFMRTNPTQNGGNHWEQGFRFRSNPCLDDTTPVQDCTSASFSYVEATTTIVDVAPLYYWATSTCSTLTNDPDEVTRRAKDKLDRSISFKLEREFWLGTQHTALGLPDQPLAEVSTSTNGGAATPFVTAIGNLVDAWGDCSKGQRAMIHLTPKALAILLAVGEGLVRKENGLLLDPFDNIYVAGTGYTGSLGTTVPAAGTEYAFITPVVNVRLANTETVMSEPSNGEGETRVDIPNNLDRAVAFRAGAVYMDPCCSAYALLDLTKTIV